MLEILPILLYYFRTKEKDDSAELAERFARLMTDVRSAAGTEVDEREWEPWFDAVQAWLWPKLNPSCPAEIVEVNVRKVGTSRWVATGSVDVSFQGRPPVRNWFVVEFDSARPSPFGDVLDIDPRPAPGV